MAETKLCAGCGKQYPAASIVTSARNEHLCAGCATCERCHEELSSVELGMARAYITQRPGEALMHPTCRRIAQKEEMRQMRLVIEDQPEMHAVPA